eukprot:g698.t1
MAKSLLIIIAYVGLASASPSNPARPQPSFSWETVPIAFHGANRSGEYNSEAIEILSQYSMVTIEKWYTACGSLHPIQAGPDCDVEKPMYAAFNAIKAKNKNVTTIMYLNSMFDFSMYKLAGLANDLEKQGKRVLLRDKNDKIVYLCNDGNYYCNVTNFDWASQAAKDLWMEEVANATAFGGVDGFFADHASAMLKPLGQSKEPTLCNGSGPKRTCWHFSNQQADAFNEGHKWLVNHTQDIVAKLGGPVVDGPYSRWGIDACDPISLNRTVQTGQRGEGPYVLEVSRGACNPTESCLASFLLVAEKFSYLACFADEPSLPMNPNFTKPLGEPLGPAVEAPPKSGLWTRHFSHGTVVRYDTKRNRGTVQWPGDPVPPSPHPTPPTPPTPPPPTPAYDPAKCGKLLEHTGQAQGDIGRWSIQDSPEACCDFCAKTPGCDVWAWHTETKAYHQCHAHRSAETTPNHNQGCYSAHMPNKTALG